MQATGSLQPKHDQKPNSEETQPHTPREVDSGVLGYGA